MAEERNFRKVRRGYVVSDKMDKTISVELEQRSTHPLYGKVVRSTSKVKAHDEHNDAHIGDLVSIMETRPLSKTKLTVRTTTALTTSPFLTDPPGMASLTEATITSPMPA